MIYVKKIAVFALLLVLIVFTSACNSNEMVANSIHEAENMFNELDNFSAEINMETEMKFTDYDESEIMQTEVHSEIVVFREPFEMHRYTEMSAYDSKSIMDEFLSEDEGIHYLSADNVEEFEQVSLTAQDIATQKAQFEFDIFLKDYDSFREMGTETVLDCSATKYKGSIKGERLPQILVATGMNDILKQMVLLIEDLNPILETITDAEVFVWVDTRGYPLRFELDLTDWMNALYANIPIGFTGGTVIEFNQIVVKIDCFQFDEAEEIILPKAS